MALFIYIILFPLCSHMSVSLTTSEKQAILDIHNELRDRVAGGALINEGHPAATDMNQLIWDDGLATLAQNFLNKCQFSHNQNRHQEIIPIRDASGTKWGKPAGKTGQCYGKDCIRIGENFAVSSKPYNVDKAVDKIEFGWFEEWNAWTFGPSSSGCTPNQQFSRCGHYTQLVWANVRYVGCAWNNNCGSSNNAFMCNYFPTGNMNGASTTPYTKASSANNKCSDCMSDRSNQCAAQYESVSFTADKYDAPYNALCGGGACPTQCAGDSFSRTNCDECNSNTDCNDGTISLSSGRNLCDGSSSNTQGTQSTSSCSNNTPFKCKDGSKCIQADWECDGYNDCGDKSDESQCANTDITDTTTGECNDCVTVSLRSALDKEYNCESATHNGQKVYRFGRLAIYYTGSHWYVWDYRGSVDTLNDNANGAPYAYCSLNSLSSCNGNWYVWNDGYYTKKPDSYVQRCSALENLDCSKGYEDSVCMRAHDTNATSFTLAQDVSAYSLELLACHNAKPMYSYDRYYLMWEERAIYNEVTDRKDLQSYWIIYGSNGEEYAYCVGILSECSVGSWHRLIDSNSFVGYVIDPQMGLVSNKECMMESEMSAEAVEPLSAYVVVVIAFVAACMILIGYCLYHRHNTSKKRASKVTQLKGNEKTWRVEDMTEMIQLEETIVRD